MPWRFEREDGMLCYWGLQVAPFADIIKLSAITWYWAIEWNTQHSSSDIEFLHVDSASVVEMEESNATYFCLGYSSELGPRISLHVAKEHVRQFIDGDGGLVAIFAVDEGSSLVYLFCKEPLQPEVKTVIELLYGSSKPDKRKPFSKLYGFTLERIFGLPATGGRGNP